MAEQELKAPAGAVKKKKIRGRGNGSGKGRKCGRGDKGQNSRSGGGVRPGFEGGQMPLYRRVARRGFSNIRFRKEYCEVNLDSLERKFEAGETVDAAGLYQRGLISRSKARIKVLGNGSLSKKLSVMVDRVSASARDKIVEAGGSVTESWKPNRNDSDKTADNLRKKKTSDKPAIEEETDGE